MSSNADEVRVAAVRELARRELERRQQPQTATQNLMRYLTTAPSAPARMPIKDLAIGAADLGVSTLRHMVNKPAASLMGIVGAINPNDTYAAARDRYRQAIATDNLMVRDERLRTPQGEQMASAFGNAMKLTGIPQALNAIGGGIERVAGPDARDFAESLASLASLGAGRVASAELGAGRVASAARAEPAAAARGGATPTLEKLRDSAQAAYNRAETGGVIVSRDSLTGIAQTIKNELRDAGARPALQPRVFAALSELEADAARPVAGHTIKGVEGLRRVIANARKGATTPDEAEIAGQMLDTFDSYLDNLGSADVIAGDASRAQALKTARNLWMRYRKGQEIDELMQRAQDRAKQFSGSGLENAIRTEFRQLALNRKRMRKFSKDEQEAIRRVGQGTATANVFRYIGKFAPTGTVSALTSMGSGLLAGSAFGGPGGAIGGVALPAAGLAGRAIATKLTSRNAERASELMRRGPARNSLPDY